jgi:hypothetical protein
MFHNMNRSFTSSVGSCAGSLHWWSRYKSKMEKISQTPKRSRAKYEREDRNIPENAQSRTASNIPPLGFPSLCPQR